jgi:hypothetical protein
MLDPWVLVVHRESERAGNHWRQQHYTVDFVQRDYLTTYLTQHLLPFADYGDGSAFLSILGNRPTCRRAAVHAEPSLARGPASPPQQLRLVREDAGLIPCVFGSMIRR